MGNYRTFIPITISLFIAAIGSFFLYKWIEKQRAPKEVVEVQGQSSSRCCCSG